MYILRVYIYICVYLYMYVKLTKDTIIDTGVYGGVYVHVSMSDF
jgi:hypothetical protein